MQPQTTPGRPRLAYFQAVVDGDVRKLQAESNDSASGGGARDLRMPHAFLGALLPFFPRKITGGHEARIYSAPKGGHPDSRVIKLHLPTNSRPNEIRIGTIHEIEGWKLSAEEYASLKHAGGEVYFLLTLDVEGRSWAQLAKHSALATTKADPNFFKFVCRAKSICGEKGKVTRGAFDFTGTNHFIDA